MRRTRCAWAKRPSAPLISTLFLMSTLALILPLPATAADIAMGDSHFQSTWAYTDQPVATQLVNRTWMWGPKPNDDAIAEPYWDSPTGWRLVQYFDKTRMEITNPGGDQASIWYVTNGLLAKELITGSMQIGDDKFVQYAPAQVNVAGDANDPNGPTYATFNTLLTAGTLSNGSTITQTVNRAGTVAENPALASYGVSAQDVGSPTNHTVASVFWDFMNSSGPVDQSGQTATDKLFQNPFYATGYPLTEPYWTTVLVGGVQKQVLVQVFERRVLTYTPSNPDGWKVEAGNVGQHYYAWRYTQLQQVAMPVQNLNTTPASVHSCAPAAWSDSDPQADVFYGQHVTIAHQETNCRVFNAQAGVWWDQSNGTVTVYAGSDATGTPLDTRPESEFVYFNEPADFTGGIARWNTTSVKLLYRHHVANGGWDEDNSTTNNTWHYQSIVYTNPPQTQSGSFLGHPAICSLDSWSAASLPLAMTFNARLEPNSLAGAPQDAIPYVFNVTGVNLDTLNVSQAVTLPQGATLGYFQGGNCLFVYMNPATAADQYTVTLNLPDGRHTSTSFQYLPSIGATPAEGSVTYQSTLDDLNTSSGPLATHSITEGVEDIQATGFADDGGWLTTGAKRSDFGDGSVSLDVRQVTAGGSSDVCLDARAVFAGAHNDYLAFCLLSSGETIVLHNTSTNGQIYKAVLFDRALRPGTNDMTAWNTLKIVSQGDVNWFYINDTLVGSSELAIPDQGTIGFTVDNRSDSPMDWQVRNFAVRGLN